MPKVITSCCVLTVVGGAVAGCQSTPAHYADEGAHATYQAASVSVSTVRSAGGEIYLGAGRALRQPFHDLNMMEEQIPPVLLRAESHPYDLSGVNSCTDVLNRVAELDLALGPDVDLPKQKRKRSARGAHFAAGAALDAAGSAADHFIPMRSTIRQLSGAQRYDNHVKHAVLSGATRRSFLKAVGMVHNCTWPAAPLDFTPTQAADVDALWVAAGPATPAMASGAGTTAVRVARVAAIAAGQPQPAMGPVTVAINDRIVLPPATPAATSGQGWRPRRLQASNRSPRPLTTTAAAGPAAPWGAGFAGSSNHP